MDIRLGTGLFYGYDSYCIGVNEMNGKMAKMLRKMNATDNMAKRLWGSLNWIQRGKVRAAFKSDPVNGSALATVVFMEQLFGRKLKVEEQDAVGGI